MEYTAHPVFTSNRSMHPFYANERQKCFLLKKKQQKKKHSLRFRVGFFCERKWSYAYEWPSAPHDPRSFVNRIIKSSRVFLYIYWVRKQLLFLFIKMTDTVSRMFIISEMAITCLPHKATRFWTSSFYILSHTISYIPLLLFCICTQQLPLAN